MFSFFSRKTKSQESLPSKKVQANLPLPFEIHPPPDFIDNSLHLHDDEAPGQGLTSEQERLFLSEDEARKTVVHSPKLTHSFKAFDLHDPTTFPSMVRLNLNEEEKSQPRILDRSLPHHQSKVSERSILDRSEFIEKFHQFSGHLLDGISWENVIVAGGAVLACLSGENEAFPSSDIDLFLHGIQTEKAANQKVREIYNLLCKNSGKKLEIIRSSRAITIFGEYPIRHFQIITRLFQEPKEVILGFDIDACCCFFDGKSIYGSERFIYSINKRVLIVNPTRRSATFESRLYKYSKRGFSVIVPNLDKRKINPVLLSLPFSRLSGLARLLAFACADANGFPKSRYAQLSSRVKAKISGFTYNFKRLTPEQQILNEYIGHCQANPSDYSYVILPFGPEWKVETVIQLIQNTDKNNSFGFKDENKHQHTYLSGLENVLNPTQCKSSWCAKCKSDIAIQPLEKDQFRWTTEFLVCQDWEFTLGYFRDNIQRKENDWANCREIPVPPRPKPKPPPNPVVLAKISETFQQYPRRRKIVSYPLIRPKTMRRLIKRYHSGRVSRASFEAIKNTFDQFVYHFIKLAVTNSEHLRLKGINFSLWMQTCAHQTFQKWFHPDDYQDLLSKLRKFTADHIELPFQSHQSQRKYLNKLEIQEMKLYTAKRAHKKLVDVRISKESSNLLLLLTNILIKKVLGAAHHVWKSDYYLCSPKSRKILSARDIQSGVRLALPAERGKYAISEGTKKVVQSFHLPKDRPQHAITAIRKIINHSQSRSTKYYLAGVLDSEIKNILVKACLIMKDRQHDQLEPSAIISAIQQDDELMELFGDIDLTICDFEIKLTPTQTKVEHFNTHPRAIYPYASAFKKSLFIPLQTYRHKQLEMSIDFRDCVRVGYAARLFSQFVAESWFGFFIRRASEKAHSQKRDILKIEDLSAYSRQSSFHLKVPPKRLLLFLARNFSPESFFYKDYLPLDMLNLIATFSNLN